MEHTIVVSSNDSSRYFPQNKPEHFVCILSCPIEIKGNWRVCLKALSFELEQAAADGEPVIFDVFMTQTSGTIFRGQESMLLSRVYTQLTPGKKRQILAFDTWDSAPIRLDKLGRIELIIKGVTPSQFLTLDPTTHTYATLVLRQD